MTIFVAGIHGVGKTFLAQPAAARLGMRYATASQLIREERGRQTWDSGKQVDDVAAYQTALITAVRRIKESGQSLLLDGHFVLRKSGGVHERLAESVFRDLGCASVLLLTCKPEVILQRLIARGDQTWGESELAAFARAEADHATLVCESLKLPLVSIDSPTNDQFDATLNLFGSIPRPLGRTLLEWSSVLIPRRLRRGCSLALLEFKEFRG